MTETALGALLIILGGGCSRAATGIIRREDGPLLVRVVINLALPPLIFLILVRADLHALAAARAGGRRSRSTSSCSAWCWVAGPRLGDGAPPRRAR